MYISGFAFSEKEKELAENNRKRYEEIKDTSGIDLEKISDYGAVRFRGKLKTPEARALSERDIALIADAGNLCFGGNCSKNSDSFYGEYFTR